MPFAIQIQHAKKTYANGFTALNDVSFNVEEGGFFALLGHNGAGKTTLISAMAGLNRLTSGRILVRGKDVAQEPYAVRHSLGVVPQELVFDPFFTVYEALRFQSGYFGIRHNNAWIDEILHHLGLSDKADTNTRNLSGGMKRRLMVAQALVHKPPVIVLDEPTAGVDVELRRGLWHFMQNLNQNGHTVILTTHYLEEAQNLCSRVAMMKNGKLLALSKTEDLLCQDHHVNVFLTLTDRLPESLSHAVIAQTDSHSWHLRLNNYPELTALLNTLASQKIDIIRMNVAEMNLEDVFVRLMQEEAA